MTTHLLLVGIQRDWAKTACGIALTEIPEDDLYWIQTPGMSQLPGPVDCRKCLLSECVRSEETMISVDGISWQKRFLTDPEFQQLPLKAWTIRYGQLIRGDADPDEVQKRRMEICSSTTERTA